MIRMNMDRSVVKAKELGGQDDQDGVELGQECGEGKAW